MAAAAASVFVVRFAVGFCQVLWPPNIRIQLCPKLTSGLVFLMPFSFLHNTHIFNLFLENTTNNEVDYGRLR